MKKLPVSVRVTIGLVSLVLVVFGVALRLGLMPDTQPQIVAARLQTAESLAMQCAMAAARGRDPRAVQHFLDRALERTPDIRSAAVRLSDGTVLAAAGDHDAMWADAPTTGSGPAHLRVPMVERGESWATLEIAVQPLQAEGWRQMVYNPTLRLAAFLIVGTFVVFLLYLRMTLRYLDPSSVIPERVKAMLDVMAEGVLVLDTRGRIVLANRGMCDLTGLTLRKLQTKNAADLAWRAEGELAEVDKGVPLVPREAYPWERTLGNGEGINGARLRLALGDGTIRSLVVNVMPVLAADGKQRGAVATFDDVTGIEQKNAELEDTLGRLERSQREIELKNQELEVLATRDTLTGCFNRRSLYQRLDAAWADSKQSGRPLGVVMLDIDRFKSINDTHGHATGDEVLRLVAAVLKETVQEPAVVGRYGGEEFCVVLPNVDPDASAAFGETIRAAIEHRNCAGLGVTSSVGVSNLIFGAEQPSELIDQADQALYVAKRTGRNRVCRFDRLTKDIPPPATPTPPSAAPAAVVAAPQVVAPHPQIPFNVVHALVSALLYRDTPTAQHSRRVADLALTAASGLLPAKGLYLLEVAALLHDIGKLGVPDTVLLKPGPLTSDEWAVMRLHAQIGVEIVATAFGCDDLTETLRAHHAWFGDASEAGDATRRRPSEIPLTARILGIADAFDAITSDRPYRARRTREEAFGELRRCAGRQFDPELVERFIVAVGEASQEHASRSRLRFPASTGMLGQELQRLVEAASARESTAVSSTLPRPEPTASRAVDVASMLARLNDIHAEAPELEEAARLVEQLLQECSRAVERTERPQNTRP